MLPRVALAAWAAITALVVVVFCAVALPDPAGWAAGYLRRWEIAFPTAVLAPMLISLIWTTIKASGKIEYLEMEFYDPLAWLRIGVWLDQVFLHPWQWATSSLQPIPEPPYTELHRSAATTQSSRSSGCWPPRPCCTCGSTRSCRGGKATTEGKTPAASRGFWEGSPPFSWLSVSGGARPGLVRHGSDSQSAPAPADGATMRRGPRRGARPARGGVLEAPGRTAGQRRRALGAVRAARQPPPPA